MHQQTKKKIKMEIKIKNEKAEEYFNQISFHGDENSEILMGVNKATDIAEFGIIIPDTFTKDERVRYIASCMSSMVLSYQMALDKGNYPFAEKDEDAWIFIPVADGLGCSAFQRKNMDQFIEMSGIK